jgi:pyruvate/2-oxoglutarate dehydrogenase complex dihydrolipoamide acyltransferase (E2) component
MPGRVDGSGSIVAELPPLDRAYVIDFRLLSDRLAEIPDDANGVLKLFDGRRTLAEVLAEADRQGLAAGAVLAKLWAEEIIQPASSPAQAGAALGQGSPRGAPGGAAETDRAEWFECPADPEPARQFAVEESPAEAAGRADGGETSAPRIVRFPAKRKEPEAAAAGAPASDVEGAAASARPLHRQLAPPGRRRMTLQRPFRRPPSSGKGARGRSAAALLVAALLAAVSIWRWAATTRPPPPTSSSPAPASHPRGR